MSSVKISTNNFIGNIICKNKFELKIGDSVVLECESGVFLGKVIEFYDDDLSSDYNLIRIATKKDLISDENNKKDEEKLLSDVRKISQKLELDMYFVDAIYSLDKKRLYISFVADNRVDFRELAKRLAQKYHSRIEFRQIGVRDKAKKVGGIGPCGLMLCCNRFLSDFDSVSINMAKNQLLALNPNKINGVCGRLKCCLKYENETYKELKKGLPKVGELVETEDGFSKVIEVDILNRCVKLETPNKTITYKFFGERNEDVR